MILNTLKQMIPASVKARIKAGKYCSNLAKRMKELELEKSNVTLMIGTPIHTNLGDHLITLAQHEFIKKCGSSNKVIEIPTEMYQIYRKRICSLNCVEYVIINGGGWMGNLWVPEELLLQQIIDDFSSKKIIIFPQTIYYDSTIAPYDSLIKSANSVFSKCRNITLCVRENNSCDFAKANYENVNILLVPDIAIAYYESAPKNNCSAVNKVGKCLREDREIFGDESIKQKVLDAFTSKGYEIEAVNTMYERRVTIEERKSVVNDRLNLFASYDFIVTDRLHGMIFSYITGTPCVVLDNKTHKVAGVYNTWLKESKKIFPVFLKLDVDLLDSFILSNSTNKQEENVCIDKEFSRLKEIV